MERAIIILPNQIRYQNNKPTGSYLQIIQALKFLLLKDNRISFYLGIYCLPTLIQAINNTANDLEFSKCLFE